MKDLNKNIIVENHKSGIPTRIYKCKKCKKNLFNFEVKFLSKGRYIGMGMDVTRNRIVCPKCDSDTTPLTKEELRPYKMKKLFNI